MRDFIRKVIETKGFQYATTLENGDTVFKKIGNSDIEVTFFRTKDEKEAIKIEFLDSNNNKIWRKLTFDHFTPGSFDSKYQELVKEQSEDTTNTLVIKKIVSELKFIKPTQVARKGDNVKVSLELTLEQMIVLDQMLTAQVFHS